ncbi:hypothetical protein D9M70_627280 [compost metagenome]
MFIFFFAHVQVRSNFWIIKWPIFKSTIIESPGYANSSNCIQTIGILHDIEFNRRKLAFKIPSLKRNIFDDVYDVDDCIFGNVLLFKKLPSQFRANGFISIMKFAIGNIVQQSAQGNYSTIAIFMLGNI